MAAPFADFPNELLQDPLIHGFLEPTSQHFASSTIPYFLIHESVRPISKGPKTKLWFQTPPLLGLSETEPS